MRLLRTPKFWASAFAGSMLLALTEAVANHQDALRGGRPSDLARLVLDRAVSDIDWVPVAAVVFATVERVMASGGGSRRLVARLAVFGVLLAPFYTTWGALVRTLIHGGGVDGFVAQVWGTPYTTIMWVVFLYAMLSLSASSLAVARRARQHERDGAELRARLAQAELELLRAQLEPHFLFNALNTIAGLIRGARLDHATAALAKLSELLRYVVEASRQDRVPLAWELEFATSYLELQQLRFGPRLSFAIHGAAPGRTCDVPPLLLQPLIENAVVHGVARTSEPVSIDVRIALEGGALQVAIDNTRDVRAQVADDTTGVGLRNTRQRLERIYGGEFALDAGPVGADHYRVTIALPRLAGPPS